MSHNQTSSTGRRWPHPEAGLEVQKTTPGLEVASTEQSHNMKPEMLHYLHGLPAPMTTAEVPHHISEDKLVQRNNNSRNPFGLSPLVFGVIIAILTAFALAAALGGGLGARVRSLSADNKRLLASVAAAATSGSSTITSTVTISASNSAMSSSTTSSTLSATAVQNYIAPSPSAVQSIDTSTFCPGFNGTTYAVLDSANNNLANFELVCSSGINAGGDVHTVLSMVAYSFDSCMRACVGVNEAANGGSGSGAQCTMVTFNRLLSTSWGFLSANCWLFNGTTVQKWNFQDDAMSAHFV